MIAVGLDQTSLASTIAELGFTAKEVKSATRRAVGAGASLLRQKMKDFVQGIGQGWDPLHPVGRAIKNNPLVLFKAFGTVTKKLGNRHRRSFQRDQTPNLNFLGKLRNVFRYSMSPEGSDPTALVGILREFVSEKAIYFFERFQDGGKLENRFRPFPIDLKTMRFYWGALGSPVHWGVHPMQPSRQIVEPTWLRNKELIQSTIRDKFEQRLAEALEKAGYKQRKPR